MTVLDLSSVCREDSIEMHAQRQTDTLVGRGPLTWFSLNLCLKQIITSGTSGHLCICLAESWKLPGMAIPRHFCTTILVKNFFPRLSLLKGNFSCYPFVMEPHLPLPRRIWLCHHCKDPSKGVVCCYSIIPQTFFH